jgi:Bacteriophage tail sheath protein
MPVSPTYPGVYIEEVPSGVRTISGVATSIAAFVGFFSRGPMDKALRVLSAGDFEREFGGLRSDSEASYAVDQFFLNGGGQAWIVRAADGNQVAARVILRNAADAADSLTVEARSPGAWGNNLRLGVDYGTIDPANTFNLTVREVVDGVTVSTETFRNLTMAAGPRNVQAVIDDGSKLIRIVAQGSQNNADRPAATGTVSAAVTAAVLAGIDGSETLTADVSGPHAVAALGAAPTSVAALASGLQAAIRAAHASLEDVTVTAYGTLGDGAVLSVRAGTSNPAAGITLSDTGGAPDTLASELGLNLATSGPNVQEYVLGGASALRQLGGVEPGNAPLPGADGGPPGAAEISAALALFDKVDLFNILCLPDTVRLPDASALAVIADATTYCENRRAFYVVDVPQADAVRDEVPEIEAWIDQSSGIRHRNLALYFPRPRIADPLDEFRLRSIPSSGTLAGLYARTDADRGVWKAPAGIDARLRGVQALEYVLTDDENGVLNPLAVNCLRNFRATGNVCWGARTLVGSNQLASEWKYVPVRRLALFLEESLYRGTQWVVFEPNDESLWAQIRLNVGAFMQGLFRQGAFQGTSAREAYLVKCDRETTTQDDVNRGIVNIVVGFAPLKPAEFVILKIQQLAGQIES